MLRITSSGSFQSTPSAWRETSLCLRQTWLIGHFNPLPPHGGRPAICTVGKMLVYFNPLPPHGGRPDTVRLLSPDSQISIHSLRMEGDLRRNWKDCAISVFQSTPSAWRETYKCAIIYTEVREFQSTPSAWRETELLPFRLTGTSYFNPLPPHGGRLAYLNSLTENDPFQSTPSAWRETRQRLACLLYSAFQSTPSAWRETAKLHRKAFFISPILVQSCKKGCKRLHSAPEKMVFFEKREKNLVRNLQHLSVRL